MNSAAKWEFPPVQLLALILRLEKLALSQHTVLSRPQTPPSLTTTDTLASTAPLSHAQHQAMKYITCSGKALDMALNTNTLHVRRITPTIPTTTTAPIIPILALSLNLTHPYKFLSEPEEIEYTPQTQKHEEHIGAASMTIMVAVVQTYRRDS
jgi:hypothetical protein